MKRIILIAMAAITFMSCEKTEIEEVHVHVTDTVYIGHMYTPTQVMATFTIFVDGDQLEAVEMLGHKDKGRHTHYAESSDQYVDPLTLHNRVTYIPETHYNSGEFYGVNIEVAYRDSCRIYGEFETKFYMEGVQVSKEAYEFK